MSTGRITFRQFKISEALKKRLEENGGKHCVIQMRLDGVQITVTRAMIASKCEDDRFTLASDQRFCWGARPKFGTYSMKSITWRRVLQVLDGYQGKVE